MSKLSPHVPQLLPLPSKAFAGTAKKKAEALRLLAQYDRLLTTDESTYEAFNEEATYSNLIEGIGDTGFTRDYVTTLVAELNDMTEHVSEAGIQVMHKYLLQHHDTKNISVGAYRTRQNCIVGVENGVQVVKYVPPEPSSIPDLVKNLVDYMNRSTDDVLIRIAVAHGQFESIHPFDDGNGRIGRMLIPVLAKNYGLVRDGSLCLSKYFFYNRPAYYNGLNSLREKGWKDWCNTFLDAVIGTMKNKLQGVEG